VHKKKKKDHNNAKFSGSSANGTLQNTVYLTGRKRCGFLGLGGDRTPPVAGANFRAALVASCLRGAYDVNNT